LFILRVLIVYPLRGKLFIYYLPIYYNMEKPKMKRYIIDKKEDIRKLDVKTRKFDVPVTKRFIISIIGPRRAGKTYSMYDIILNKMNLADPSFLYANFEDLEMKNIKAEDVQSLINIHEEIYGKKPEFLFLDEIQNIEKWEKLVFSLFEKKQFFIFISGSSSKLLSKELATQLRGRTLSHLLLPFSFREFLAVNKFEIKKFYSSSEENKIKNMLSNYLKSGGFPDVVFEEEFKDKFFKDYLDLLIFRDIVERFGIKNISVIRFLITSVLTSFSKGFSVHKNFKILKSEGIKLSKKTLYSYTMLLEDVFFSFFLKRFHFSARKSQLSIPKVYINDTGLANSVLGVRFEQELGRIAENCVFLELKRIQSKKPNMEIYYYKTLDDEEVDFVIKDGLKITQLIQVCYNIEDFNTKERELKDLIKSSKEIK